MKIIYDSNHFETNGWCNRIEIELDSDGDIEYIWNVDLSQDLKLESFPVSERNEIKKMIEKKLQYN